MNENKARQEYYDEKSKSASSAKGTRTTTVTGEALKSKLRSGEITG